MDKLIHALPVTNVESDRGRLVGAVPPDEVVEALLPAADGNDKRAFLDEAVGHGGPDAGGGTDHEDTFVLKGHFEEVYGILSKTNRGRKAVITILKVARP